MEVLPLFYTWMENERAMCAFVYYFYHTESFELPIGLGRSDVLGENGKYREAAKQPFQPSHLEDVRKKEREKQRERERERCCKLQF